MKKTDIGVVGFMYGVCILFLVMTLQLKKAAQTYPLFIITLLALLTTLYVYNMVKDAKRLGVTSGLEEGDTIAYDSSTASQSSSDDQNGFPGGGMPGGGGMSGGRGGGAPGGGF